MIPTLQDFAGRWSLTRVIDDALGAGQGRLEGEARFTPCTGGLRCDEEGLLRLPGQALMTARRSFLWSVGGAGIDVSFDDSRPFHSFDPGANPCTARHDCAPDLYLVRYDFARWPAWRVEWTVTGPRKSYVMRSDLRPAGGGTCGTPAAGAET